MNKYPNLSLAIASVFEAEVDDFMSQLDPKTDITLSEKTEKKLSKLAKRRDRAYYPLICTAGRRLACLAAFLLVLSVSAMSIKPVRAAVVDFFTEVFTDHIRVTAVQDAEDANNNVFVKHELLVPDGFALKEDHSTESMIDKMYVSGDKYIFYLQIPSSSFSSNIDNEHSVIENYTDDEGQTYMIQETSNLYNVIWRSTEYVYSIKSNLNKNEIINLCKHTK